MIIIDCMQGEDSWWAARLGIPTASEFDKIITPAQLKPSTSAKGYMDKLVGEWYRGKPDETFKSDWMKRGNEMEDEARAYYEFQYSEVQRVGFCKVDSGLYGCSPDSLVGDDGGLEIKCFSPGVMVRSVLDNRVPLAYKMQVVGCLLVTGREWWDFLPYHPEIKQKKIRTYRKDVLKELTALEAALDKFCAELLETRELFKQRMAA